MTRKLRLIPIASAIGLIACVIWIFFHFREPKFQGKPLSTWLQEARENGEIADLTEQDDLNSPSARAIQAMGTDALPPLIRRVRERDSAFRDSVRTFLEQHAWIGLHPRPFEVVQEETAFAFAALGPMAKPAVPQLIRLLESDGPEVRFMAAFCLSRIGPVSDEVAPALVKFANRSLQTNSGPKFEREARSMAAYSLGRMGEAARPALPQLTVLANDTQDPARWMAKAALLKLDGRCLEQLVQSLTSNPYSSTNWLDAARVMQWAGPAGAPAVPALIGALQNTNQQILETAVQGLGGIHSTPEISIPALRPLIHSTNGFVRWHTLEALRRFKGSPVDAQTIAELVSCLLDPDEGIRQRATNALRSLAPDAARKAGVQP
jgi:HEAT repeat protein